MTGSDTTEQKHFVTPQDLRNITRAIKDFGLHRHAEDAISMERIVNKLKKQEPFPTLADKQQGLKHPSYLSLPEESFLLVIMTRFQAKLFSEYASNIPCIDATYRTSKYKFKLITLHVVDKYRKSTYGGGDNEYYKCYILQTVIRNGSSMGSNEQRG